MTEQEKIFLIECLLRDIRASWAEKVSKRTRLAKSLCLGLGGDFCKLAIECDKFLAEEFIDGRFFRTEFPYGYEDMDMLHKLPHTLNDKSDEFKKYVEEYILYPESLFKDIQGE